MNSNVYSRLKVVHQIEDSTIFRLCLLAMLSFYLVEMFTGGSLSLQTLYPLTLGFLILKCNRKVFMACGVAVALMLQVACLLTPAYSLGIVWLGNLLSAVTATLLTAFAVYRVRSGFLRVLGESTTDALTGLGNRRSLERFLDAAITKTESSAFIFSLVILDLDGFKKLNDTCGHLAGDRALCVLADVLRNRVRKTDFAARIGGDEFAVVLMHTHERDGEVFCAHLLSTLAPVMEKHGLYLTASIGCKTFKEPPSSVIEALKLADHAMYAAKHSGKHCVVHH